MKNNYNRGFRVNGVNNNRRRRIINRVPPVVSTTPQTYGPGRLIAHITDDIIRTTAVTVESYHLGERLKGNSEFLETVNKYKFFKILGIKVILKPYNYVNTSETGAFLLNWDSEVPDNFLKDDSAKIFGPVNPRMKVWKFIPPDMVIGTTAQGTAPVNLRTYINAKRFVIPCWFHVVVGFQGFVDFQIEWIIEFRGLSLLPTSTKIESLEEQLRMLKLKLKEEEKEKIKKLDKASNN